MRAFLIIRLALFAVGLSQSATIANAALFTAQNLALNVGQNGTINVIWSSTQTLNYINTQFVLRAVTGSTGGAVFTETAPGVPPMPPITAGNYLFSGNSSAVTAGGNPSSVGTDAWVNDSWFLIDATDNGLDYSQDGSRLWTTLDITGVTAGTYQLHLLSSEYDYSATGGSAISLTDSDLFGGLISVSAVPEPGSNLALLALGAGGLTSHRRRK